MAKKSLSLKSTTATAPEVTPFHITVDKAQIIDPEAIRKYFLQYMSDSPEVALRVSQVNVGQIITTLKEVDVSGLSEDDALQAQLSGLANASFVMQSQHVPTAAEQLAISAPEHDLAVRLAKEMPDAVLEQLSVSYEGKKAFDEGPIMTLFAFRDRYAETMVGNIPWIASLPPIGSRFQKGKHDAAPYGHRLPSEERTEDKERAKLPIWEKPYEYYLDKEGKAQNFVRDLYLNTGEGRTELTNLDYARGMSKSTPTIDQNTPKALRELFDAKKQTGMLEYVKTAEEKINTRVKILRTSLAIWQRFEAWREHFGGKMIARFADEKFIAEDDADDVKATARRAIARKKIPVQLCVVSTNKSGDKETEPFATIPVSAFLSKDKEPRQWAVNVSPAKIIERKPRKVKAAGDVNKPGGASSATVNTVTDVAAFEEAIVNCGGWVGDLADITSRKARYQTIREAATKDGSFAYALVRLEGVIDGILNEDIRRKATAWDAEQVKASVDADKANETKAA